MTGLRRIVVIGRAGSGKTTAARYLGASLGLPVTHLDRLSWGPGWTEVDRDEFERRQSAVIAGDSWVIDGGYLSSRGWQERLGRADLVVLTEAPLLVCLARIVRRAVLPARVRRPDLPDGCDDQLSLYFVWWTMLWARRHRWLAAQITARRPDLRTLRVRSTQDLRVAIELEVGARPPSVPPLHRAGRACHGPDAPCHSYRPRDGVVSSPTIGPLDGQDGRARCCWHGGHPGEDCRPAGGVARRDARRRAGSPARG